MKLSAILTILFGLFLITIAIGIFQSIFVAEADDIIFYIFGMIFSGFGGFAFVCAGINNYNKGCNNDTNN